MELVDRYLQEVGAHLPYKQRADILSELGSSIADQLEARSGGEATESEVVQVLTEMGPPRQVAASFFPEGSYLVGPELFPLFRMVAGIVLLAVIGGQLVAALVSFVFSQEPVALLDTFWGVVNSIPAALGWLLIVFVVLQWLQVRPEHEEKEFDPRMLPPLRDFEPVNRIEQLVDIIFGVIFLFFFSLFAENLFQAGIIRQGFLANPVIVQYLPWISLSILLGLIVDILLLWRGHWQPSLRLAKIAANLFSLGLLFLMIQGHTRWLQDAGVSGFIRSLVQMPQSFMQGTQVAGMVVFRMALSVAFVIIAIETLVQLYRLVRGLLRSNRSQPASLVGAK